MGWPATLPASPAEQFGLGAESQALAGTGASYATGFSSTFSNPALLAADPSRQLALGLHSANFQLSTSDPAAGALDDHARALQLGVTAPLGFPDPVADRLVLGLGVSTAGPRIARVAILDETRPQFPLLARRADSLNSTFGLGARLSEEFYAGIGAMVLAGLRGRIEIDAGTQAGSAENVTDDELVLAGAPIVGAAWQSESGLRLGLAYRGQLQASFDLLVTVENLDLLTLPPFHINGLAQIDPAQLALEAAYDSTAWLLVVGATFKRWSAIDGFREATVRCPAEQPECEALREVAIELDDTLVPRLAAEHRLPLGKGATAALRAGYFYEPTPLPPQRGNARLLDNPRHVVSVGYGILLTSPWPRLSVSWALQYHRLTRREHPVAPEPLTSTGGILGFGLTAEAGF